MCVYIHTQTHVLLWTSSRHTGNRTWQLGIREQGNPSSSDKASVKRLFIIDWKRKKV